MIDVLRLIAGGILAVISSYIGLMFKNRYKAREKFYSDAKNFAEILKRDVGLFEKPMPEIIKDYLPSAGAEFAELLNTYSVNIKEQNVDFSHLEKVRLKDGEIKDLERFFSALGKSALNEQLNLISAFYNTCDERYKVCKEETKRLGGMYFKLFVLLGVALMIIVA